MVKKSVQEEQKKVFTVLKAYISEKGFAPTERELCELTGNPRSTLHACLVRLKYDGMIDYIPQKSRTIRILAE